MHKLVCAIVTAVITLIVSIASVVAVAQPVFSECAPKIFFSSTRGQYIADGKPVKSYFWSAQYDFGDTFASNAYAQAEYNQYQHLITWFPYLNWGALGLALTYGIVSSANNVYNDGVFWVSFLVPWISGIVVAGHANAHLQRAINLYNGVDPSVAQNHTTREMRSPRVAINLLQFDF